MAIAGRLEHLPLAGGQPAGQRRGHRRTLQLETQGALASGAEANVMVHNISATGMLVESGTALAPGDGIEIDLPHAGVTAARVVWASGSLFGCQFDRPISEAALSAAQLRSAVAAPLELAPHPTAAAPTAGESFALRLQRLRKARGLSLSRVAAELGVSKPTVWAWEQGKARPVEARMTALAEVLGVERVELVAGAHRRGLGDVIARAREQIAAEIGASTESVRIMVEL